MTNEQKAAVQKAALAAARSVEQRDTPIATAIERSHIAKWFKAGAQTILDNPQEWGLFTPDQMRGQRKHNHVETWYESHIQKEKYREALERLLEENMCSHAGDELIEEALKTGGKQ